MYIKELRDKGEAASSEDIELSEEDYKRLLADLFIAKYPQLAKRSLLGTPTLIDDDKINFYTVVKQKLREEEIATKPQRQQALASKRRRAIVKYLLQKKGIDCNRVFILNTKVEPKISKNGIGVELVLRRS